MTDKLQDPEELKKLKAFDLNMFAGTATSARQGLPHHEKSGRILSERWKTRGSMTSYATPTVSKCGQGAVRTLIKRDGTQKTANWYSWWPHNDKLGVLVEKREERRWKTN